VISTEGMPETPAQVEGEPQGQRDATTGRFRAGHGSANPGGRPRRDQVVRRLARRRGASEAVALLCELLDGEAAVIVIDARAVLDELGPRRRRGDGAPGLLAPAEPLSPAAIWRRRYNELLDAAEDEWIESVEEVASGRGVSHFDLSTYRHKVTGQELGEWDWGEWCEQKAMAGLVAEGLPAEEPEEAAFGGRATSRAAEDEGCDC
jgi:hypothetical protein